MARNIIFWFFLMSFFRMAAPGPARALPQDNDGPEKEPKRGLLVSESGASPGYTLISPFSNGFSYLLDLKGRVVHKWESRYRPGLAPYLLPNGNLLRGIQIELDAKFKAGGISGGIQEFGWDGELLWEFHLASDLYYHHHDIEPLPNGNFLVIAYEPKTKDEVLAVGRRPTHAGKDGLWSEVILEIEPLRPFGARVVWEWHVWDHLIQDIDSKLPNYGIVANHPERVDINGDIPRDENSKEESISAEERAQLIALGYLDESDADTKSPDTKKESKADEEKERKKRERADWLHINGVDYNAKLDQIVLSSWQMSEIWIIDHSTTKEQSAEANGGRSGSGGNLLYRWGNPQTYKRGTEKDRKLFHQHDAQWIPQGLSGAGNLTIFNNGRKRPEKEYSSALEIVPPLSANGTYTLPKEEPFGPTEPHWAYAGDGENRFFASFISGTHRLPNGNTLICSGPQGRVFEVKPEGKIIWDYHNPFGDIPENGKPNDFTYGMFRATRIPPDHEGLRGKELTPLDPQPRTGAELLASRPKPGDAPSGWQDLVDEKAGLVRWRSVNCETGVTFRIDKDPEEEKKKVLICSGAPNGIIRSDRRFENFIFDFEWRHTKEGAYAGVLIWADPVPSVGSPFPRGIEIDLSTRNDGTESTAHGDIAPVSGSEMTPDPRFRASGSRSLPKEDAQFAKPAGLWNHYRITGIEGTVRLEVNGKVATGGSHCTPSKGYIALQSRGSEVHFRNLKVWDLPVGSHGATAGQTAPEGLELGPLYNGINLDGWKVINGKWTAEDWLLACKGVGTMTADLPLEITWISLDFRRKGMFTDSPLPILLGTVSFKSTGEKLSEWNRVHLVLTESEVTATFAGRKQSRPRPREVSLRLASDGASTEFCNVFGGK